MLTQRACVPAGTVSNAAMMSMSGKVLSEKLDVLRLTFYTSPISCLCLLPFYYLREVHPLSAHIVKAPVDETSL